MENTVSELTLARLPRYLDYLKKMVKEGKTNVSSTTIAKALNLGDVQVRKDLASISVQRGKPKTGYDLALLIQDLENYLGYNAISNAIIIGAGKLGKALLDYTGFAEYGLHILCAFDKNISSLTKSDLNKDIYPLHLLDEICQNQENLIGIITVPASSAQEICDKLVTLHIKAIWNFAPVNLKTPDDVLVQNENMAHRLAILSKHLKDKLN